jgi:hypothetical protein
MYIRIIRISQKYIEYEIFSNQHTFSTWKVSLHIVDAKVVVIEMIYV